MILVLLTLNAPSSKLRGFPKLGVPLCGGGGGPHDTNSSILGSRMGSRNY